MNDPTGERRHETCRYGALTEAWDVDGITGREIATLTHLCHWEPPACPPALARMWGGLVEPARDCAVCPVYEALNTEATPRWTPR